MKKTLLLYFSLLIMFSQLSAQQTVGVFLNDSLSVNGYTLFGKGYETYLIDNCGYVVNSWESDFLSNTSMYLLENGNLLRTCRIGGNFSGGGIAGRIELSSWDGELLWFYNYATSAYHQHHDVEPLPNGNILVIAWEKRTQIEAIEAGRDPLDVTSNGMWPEQVVEIEMIGNNEINVVWEWHLWDHLVQEIDPLKDNYGVVTDHPELVDINYGSAGNGFPGSGADWVHFNAVAYNPALDQIALSSRHFSEIWIIDHSTTTQEAASHTGGNAGKGGDILYRWGNPEVYQRGTNEDQTLFGQHNITWILEETHPHFGKLLVFNNGAGRPGGNFSTIDIWTAPTNGNGQYIIDANDPFGPNEPEWTFEEEDFFAANISGVHALPNGNLLVCEGNDGRLFEVTLDKEIVWEFISPVANQGGPVSQGEIPPNNAVFRGTRYPANYSAFEGKDLTPIAPLELDPWPSDCMIFDDPVLAATERHLHGVWLENNPVGESLHILNDTGDKLLIEIWDGLGRMLAVEKSGMNKISIPSYDWSPGIYFLRIFNEKNNHFVVFKFVKSSN